MAGARLPLKLWGIQAVTDEIKLRGAHIRGTSNAANACGRCGVLFLPPVPRCATGA